MTLFIPQSSVPDVWSWTEFIRTITGPIIAALVLIVGIYLKEYFDRRRATQQWFRQAYVTEGIDPLIAHLHEIVTGLISMRIVKEARPFSPIALSVVSRLDTVIRSTQLLGVLTHLEWYLQTLHSVPEASRALSDLSTRRIELVTKFLSTLDAIRKELLEVKITHEKQIYAVASLDQIRQLTTRLDSISAEFLDKDKVEIAKFVKAIANSRKSED